MTRTKGMKKKKNVRFLFCDRKSKSKRMKEYREDVVVDVAVDEEGFLGVVFFFFVNFSHQNVHLFLWVSFHLLLFFGYYWQVTLSELNKLISSID